MTEQQFKSCVMPLHKTLFAYAFAILRDERDAEDCLQEAMTLLWDRRSRLSEIQNPEGYICVTVKHIALNMAARKDRPLVNFGDRPPDVADSRPSPEIQTEGKDNLKTVAELLKRLPENQRTVVVMSAVTGLSNSEISQATGLSAENVRVLLSRGRKKLRELFYK